ncbi:MAG: alpha-aminoadipate/glutamate carrier protein LysW/ArgW [Thaumarchaeota archaeon]|nr:alpha-aminoadipate/glutamate carrier protein LysW/ArgW [Nitrososphaerota archaeon]
MTITAKCEECGADIAIPDDAIVGEIVQCKECSSEFEVSSIAKGKVELKPAEVAEEDWGE